MVRIAVSMSPPLGPGAVIGARHDVRSAPTVSAYPGACRASRTPHGENLRVPSFAHRVTLNAVEADLSAVRWLSAIRRGLVVVAVLVGGIVFINPQSAINAATAALLIGLLDKGRSPRSTWRTMAVGTAMLCVVTLFCGLASSTVATLALLVVLALCSGISVGIEQRAPQIFLFGAILAAAQVSNPLDRHSVVAAVALLPPLRADCRRSSPGYRRQSSGTSQSANESPPRFRRSRNTVTRSAAERLTCGLVRA